MKRRSTDLTGLSIAAGPAPVAVAGAWSIALATPYLGPLIGLPAEPGEWLETLIHLGIGLPLLGGAIVVDNLATHRHTAGAELVQKAPWLVLAAGIVLTVTHWFTVPALDGGHPTWTRLITHLAPGFLAMASAAAGFRRRRNDPKRRQQTTPAEGYQRGDT
ncbi:MAG: hypothetical protein KY393_07645 [Actinobacteria bacterium]|nr:hypothetical protein [Actinomycetota bacterium]